MKISRKGLITAIASGFLSTALFAATDVNKSVRFWTEVRRLMKKEHPEDSWYVQRAERNLRRFESMKTGGGAASGGFLSEMYRAAEGPKKRKAAAPKKEPAAKKAKKSEPKKETKPKKKPDPKKPATKKSLGKKTGTAKSKAKK